MTKINEFDVTKLPNRRMVTVDQVKMKILVEEHQKTDEIIAAANATIHEAMQARSVIVEKMIEIVGEGKKFVYNGQLVTTTKRKIKNKEEFKYSLRSDKEDEVIVFE